jgi:ADP-heptose:LPS heptosyltransferase
VAILRALGLGDFLTGVPALRALARAFPGHRRVLLAPRALAPLATLLDGAVDEVAPMAGLDAPLPPAAIGADVAVNLHGRGPQSHVLLRGGGPGRLIAFREASVHRDPDAPVWRVGEHEVRRWCRMLRESGIPADPSDLSLHPPGGPVPTWARGATVLHAGAGDPSRRWPVARWARVARAERDAGRAVLLTGSRAERALAERAAAAAGLPPCAVLAGRTDVLELAALVAASGRVVSGDTGVAHLATALDTPSVVLFGPTSPQEWGPPPGRRHRVLWSGRLGDPHAGTPDPGLLEIEPDAVLAALAELPAR